MSGALGWCVHGWVEYVIRHWILVDPSSIVDFCSGAFRL